MHVLTVKDNWLVMTLYSNGQKMKASAEVDETQSLEEAHDKLLLWEDIIRDTEDCTMHVTKDEQNTEANTDS